MSRGLLALAAMVGLIFALAQPVRAAYYYYITDLGTLGGTTSRAYDINNATPAKVVGQAATTDGKTHAYLYKPMTDLGTLLGGGDSYARALNDRGQVVGYATGADGKQHAFLYSGSFPLQDLGTLDRYPCDAAGINASGQVVGAYTKFDAYARLRPFIWSSGTGMVDLLTLPPVSSEWSNGRANGINDAGQVTGYAVYAPTGANQAFLYTPGTGMAALGTLGGRDSLATALNASGKVVGYSSTADGTQHAFYYGGSGSLVDLGTFGGDKSFARAINAKGEVVGQAQLPGNVNTPFIWSETTGKVDLSTVVGNNTSWYLSDALAINDAGVIVGTGSVKIVNGTQVTNQAHGFMLTPATPVTVTTTSLPTPKIGDPFSRTLAATGGVPPYRWSIVAGVLPPGLTLSSAGVIVGIPTTNSSYTFTVEARDTVGLKGVKEFTLFPSTVFITTSTLPNATVGTNYGYTLGSSGGVLPHTFAVVGGSLPPGFTLTTAGVLRGTPTAAIVGSYTFSLQVTDATGMLSPPRSYRLNIVIGPLSITTASPLANATVNSSYYRTVVATGGVKPYTWSVSSGTLPPGLSLNSSTGAISGRPTTAGTSTFTVTVTDSQATAVSASKVFSLQVLPAP